MIHVHSHGVDLRLSHRFDSGWWVREARTSATIGTVYRSGNNWTWSTWPGRFGSHQPMPTRKAACDALVVWYREHDPGALGATTTEVKV